MRLLPSWWCRAHTEAAELLAACTVAGAAIAVLGAIVDRRLRHG